MVPLQCVAIHCNTNFGRGTCPCILEWFPIIARPLDTSSSNVRWPVETPSNSTRWCFYGASFFPIAASGLNESATHVHELLSFGKQINLGVKQVSLWDTLSYCKLKRLSLVLHRYVGKGKKLSELWEEKCQSLWEENFGSLHSLKWPQPHSVPWVGWPNRVVQRCSSSTWISITIQGIQGRNALQPVCLYHHQ